jgi:hypothetical protein
MKIEDIVTVSVVPLRKRTPFADRAQCTHEWCLRARAVAERYFRYRISREIQGVELGSEELVQMTKRAVFSAMMTLEEHGYLETEGVYGDLN